VTRVLDEAEAGAADDLVFAVPSGVTWQLPLYELALEAAVWLDARGAGNVRLTFVTPEDHPLATFGEAASEAVTRLLDERGIGLRTGTHPATFADGVLTVLPRASIRASHVLALPRLEGNAPGGVPADPRGYVAVDDLCRVRGLTDVYAAGDVTSIPVKQGGLAAQQADVAAEAIAASFGLAKRPAPFRPVLRGLLLTGRTPTYLRTDFGAGSTAVGVDPLWWPPAKIVGRHLAPYLARRVGVSLEAPARGDVIPVEVAVGGA
jgi:sulfide:quinone oxidoreductase